MHDFIKQLGLSFALKDLGPLHYFLGIEVSWLKNNSIHLSQAKYINDLLRRTNMDHSKPQPSPMLSSLRLTADESASVDDPTLYRSIVGALQYATVTRPEISFSVNRVCQYMHKPQIHHWKAVKRILRYLAGTSTHGLLLTPSPNYSITGFSDSDWATDLDDRKSTTGYCIFVGRNLVSWSSKKQKAVSRSSTEAEYRSIAAALADITWIQTLLTELRIPSSSTPIIHSDNLGAVHIAANPVLHSRSKHFELDLHFVRDRVQHKQLLVVHLPSQFQIADVLTKPLSGTMFQKFKDKLRVVDNSPISLWGGVRDNTVNVVT